MELHVSGGEEASPLHWLLSRGYAIHLGKPVQNRDYDAMLPVSRLLALGMAIPARVMFGVWGRDEVGELGVCAEKAKILEFRWQPQALLAPS